MTSETSGETSSLEHLHREAFNCLDTFADKIIELNGFIDQYIPKSVKNNKCDENTIGRKARCQSTLSTTKNCDLNSSVSDFGASSYYSLPVCERSRSRYGICKRKYYRSRGVDSCNGRRRPGPLGQLLAFIVSSLTACTKKIVVAPSKYLIDNVVSTFFQRRELKNAECGPSPDWDSSLSTCAFTPKKDTTVIGQLIDIMRPAVVKLITDTTILKRWLQAVALATPSPSTELTNATRNTETIDCWSYELFFHLKYLQANRTRRSTVDKVVVEEESKPNELIHANLWHRLVQLRDNYIILYETLQTYEKTYQSESEKQQQE